MSDEKIPNELFDILQIALKNDDEVAIKKAYKYVIYVRKSTESQERQARSLGDQLIDCEELVAKEKLNVVDVFRESESAKEPGIRPKFRAMLDDIEKGKYDGIIAWHPDRLARNMRDAGEIIDNLDKLIIKDLKFPTFSFENNGTGKMLLGMAFVLSKQYSDHLSDSVKRGNKRSLKEGKYINKAKRGYFKDINQFLRPNGENFVLIKQAFEKRLNGESLKEIAAFLNENNYSERNKAGKNETKKLDEKRVSEFLRDPIYAGVLLYGENLIDLTEVCDFVPATTDKDFLKINKVSDIRKAFKLADKLYSRGVIKADLMRGIVTCGECGKRMTTGITPKVSSNGKITNYFYFRCETAKCKYKGKSTRAKVIMDFIDEFLEKHFFTSMPIYEHFLVEMEKTSIQKEKELQSNLKTLILRKNAAEGRKKRIKDFLLDEKEIKIKESFKEEFALSEKEIEKIDEEIARHKEAIENNKNVVMDYKNFLELFNNLPSTIRKMKYMKDIDAIVKKLFLNFTINNKKVAEYKLNHPFDEFVQKGLFLDCRTSKTLREHLWDSIKIPKYLRDLKEIGDILEKTNAFKQFDSAPQEFIL